MWPRIHTKKPVVVAVGVFDGVHIGHQTVLRRVHKISRRLGGESAVVAFARHPLTVLRPSHAPPVLTDPAQKFRALKQLGLDHTFVVPFTRRLARVKARDFLQEYLVTRLGARCLVVGANFSFGHDREGNVAYLRQAGPRVGCRVMVVPAVKAHGHRVSSTHIRNLLRRGKVEEAAKFLGRPYELEGRVERGSGIGRSLGYPTANIGGLRQMLPGNGVYVVKMRVGGCFHGGMANVGIRPTVARTRDPRLEVHLFNWKRSVYGQPVAVSFLHRLRSEKKFPSLVVLKGQLGKDERVARAWLV